MIGDSIYEGYVTSNKNIVHDDTLEFKDSVDIGHVRRHPVLSNTWILSVIYSNDMLNDIHTLDPARQRFRVSEKYIVDTFHRTCTCPSFIKGSGRTPIHKRSCKHIKDLKGTLV